MRREIGWFVAFAFFLMWLLWPMPGSAQELTSSEETISVAGTAIGERAARLHVGHEHDPFRIENLRGFRHEMHTGEQDDVGLGALRGLCELQ